MTNVWELRDGKVLVVEDASTASLVIVAKDLKDRADKVGRFRKFSRSSEADDARFRDQFCELDRVHEGTVQ